MGQIPGIVFTKFIAILGGGMGKVCLFYSNIGK